MSHMYPDPFTRQQGSERMKDYGALIPCPECGAKHHVTPRQLQTELQFVFGCTQCGRTVTHDNEVAIKIYDEMYAIREGLGRIKI
jgi:DNA-directed RNA polymerase subunit RPC12/RpoP